MIIRILYLVANFYNRTFKCTQEWLCKKVNHYKVEIYIKHSHDISKHNFFQIVFSMIGIMHLFIYLFIFNILDSNRVLVSDNEFEKRVFPCINAIKFVVVIFYAWIVCPWPITVFVYPFRNPSQEKKKSTVTLWRELNVQISDRLTDPYKLCSSWTWFCQWANCVFLRGWL